MLLPGTEAEGPCGDAPGTDCIPGRGYDGWGAERAGSGSGWDGGW